MKRISHGFIALFAILVASMCWSTIRLQFATSIVGDHSAWQEQNSNQVPADTSPIQSSRTTTLEQKSGVVGGSSSMERKGLHSSQGSTPSCDYHSLQPVFSNVRASSDDQSKNTAVILKARCTDGLVEAPSLLQTTNKNSTVGRPIVAVLAATRSTRFWNTTKDSVLQQYLIPSLLTSVSHGEIASWDIRLYIAVDDDDTFWLNTTNWMALEIPSYLTVHVHTFSSPKSHIPFNEIAKVAYDDGAMYFCRVNDDSKFQSHEWITMATNALQKFSALPNLGVVGPICLKGDNKMTPSALMGNSHILTHDFVHRTHMDIFEGLYYPSEFDNWYVDDWITNVYSKNLLGIQRMKKLSNWTVHHFLGEPRYKYDTGGYAKLPGLYTRGLSQVRRYVQQHDPQHLHLLKPEQQQQRHVDRLPKQVSTTTEDPTCDTGKLHPAHGVGELNQSSSFVLKTRCASTASLINSTTKPILAVVIAMRSEFFWRNTADSALQKYLIPSLQSSVSNTEIASWDIRLYIAVDDDDEFWKKERIWTKLMIPSYLSIHVHTFSSPKSHIPFNEIAKVAYDDGAAYFCRVNDDSNFQSREWITMATNALQEQFSVLPNLGVVGPICLKGDNKMAPSALMGNNEILTHDFVHRTHMDIFEGLYYPSEFDNWYVDDWITNVYSERTLGIQRMVQLSNWTVQHYMGEPRYKHTSAGYAELPGLYARGLEQVRRYVQEYYPQQLDVLKQPEEPAGQNQTVSSSAASTPEITPQQRPLDARQLVQCDSSVLQPVRMVEEGEANQNMNQSFVLKANCGPSSTQLATFEATRPIVAVVIAMRSGPDWHTAEDSMLQQYLLSSLQSSVSDTEIASWDVRLYIGIDDDDNFWLNTTNWMNLRIPSYLTVHVQTCSHPKFHIPFNEIAKAAYDDGATYFCRVNDDSEFQSHEWITMATRTLREFSVLPNLGVVGPTCTKGVKNMEPTTIKGNKDILTHDFVHRTHLDIFEGLYYPTEFDNWYVDDWITNVYSERTLGIQRKVHLKDWTVVHYMGKPRYRRNLSRGKSLLPGLYARGLEQVRRYVQEHSPQHLDVLKQPEEPVVQNQTASSSAATSTQELTPKQRLDARNLPCDSGVLQPVRMLKQGEASQNMNQTFVLKANCGMASTQQQLATNGTTRPIVAVMIAQRSSRKWRTVKDSLLQQVLIPSLQTFVSQDEIASWDVRLYIGIDDDDEFWHNKRRWQRLRIPSYLSVHVHSFPHAESHVPFNEIAKAAYDDGATYFCRMNDDSEFQSHNWITMATNALQELPVMPNLGVVGPMCINGNNKILTHDFVHRTHLEIFDGLYYPAEFDNCYVDDWITYVYSNSTLGMDDRMMLLSNWTVRHFIRPSRYKFKSDDAYLLPGLYAQGLEQVRRYVQTHHPQHTSLLKEANNSLVVTK